MPKTIGYTLATYRQVGTESRDAVIAAAPESQNTHDRNKLTGDDHEQSGVVDGAYKTT